MTICPPHRPGNRFDILCHQGDPQDNPPVPDHARCTGLDASIHTHHTHKNTERSHTSVPPKTHTHVDTYAGTHTFTHIDAKTSAKPLSRADRHPEPHPLPPAAVYP